MDEMDEHRRRPTGGRGCDSGKPGAGKAGNGYAQTGHTGKQGMIETKDDSPDKDIDTPFLNPALGIDIQKIIDILDHREAHSNHGSIDNAVEGTVQFVPPDNQNSHQGQSFQGLLH